MQLLLGAAPQGLHPRTTEDGPAHDRESHTPVSSISLERRVTTDLSGLGTQVGPGGGPYELSSLPEDRSADGSRDQLGTRHPNQAGPDESKPKVAMPRSMSVGSMDHAVVSKIQLPTVPVKSHMLSPRMSISSMTSSSSARPRLWSGMEPVREEKQDGSGSPRSAGPETETPKGRQSLSVPTPVNLQADRRGSLSSNASIRSYCAFGKTESVGSVASTVSGRWSEGLSMKDMVTLCREGHLLKWARQTWRQFSFFGVTRDSTPRVWGNRVKSNTRRVSTDSNSGQSIDKAKTKKLSKMLKSHTHQDEMRLQLRDDRVDLTYLDAFATDHNDVDGYHVRVFSFGATLLEYLKIFCGMWVFFVSLTLVAFWEVIMMPDNVNQQFTLMLVDLVVDFVYVACLVVQLRTTILDVSSGREYCSSKKIVRTNLSSRLFWADCMTCLPLLLFSGIFKGSRIIRWITLVKACRGWRICRTPPEHRFVPSTVFQLVQLSCSILMGGHFIACAWFMLVHEGEDTMRHHVPWNKEAYRDCLGESGPTASCFWNLYTVSINQGIYLLMGIECSAYSALEHVFLSLCAPFGALVHAYMLGQIILLIQRRGALETKQNEHTMAIQEAMRILGLAPNLQMRIVTFFTYERIHRSNRLLQGLFTDLSPQLRFELQLHCYLDLVAGSGLFRKARPRVIREIVVSLVDIIFLPGDWICRYGDYGDSMYFIVSGACAVISQDTVTELRVLTNGAYFGEVALLTGVTRTAYVRANSFCIMAHLTKEKFRPIVEKWPEETCDVLIGAQKESDQLKIKAEATRHYALSSRRMSVQSTGGLPGLGPGGFMSQVNPNMGFIKRDSKTSFSNLDANQMSPVQMHRRDSNSSQRSGMSVRSEMSSHNGMDRVESPASVEAPSLITAAPRPPSEDRAARIGDAFASQRKEVALSSKPTSDAQPPLPGSTEVQAFNSTFLTKPAVAAFSQDKNTRSVDQVSGQVSSPSERSSSSSDDESFNFGNVKSVGSPSNRIQNKTSNAHRPNEWRLSIPPEAPPDFVPRPPDMEEDLVLEDVQKPSKPSENDHQSLAPLASKGPSTQTTMTAQKVVLKSSTKESSLQSGPVTLSEVTTANSLLKDENEMLRKVRRTLQEVAKHVSHLQTEVYDQQEVLRSSLLDVRMWAAEATRDAVSHEVMKYQSELNSAIQTPDSSLPLATPFT